MTDEGHIYTWLHLFGVKVCGKFASSRLLRAQWAYYINTSPISPRPIIKLRTPSATPSKSRRTRGSVSTHYRDRRFLNEYGRVPQPFTGSSLISLIRVSRHQIGTCGTFCFFPRRHHHLVQNRILAFVHVSIPAYSRTSSLLSALRAVKCEDDLPRGLFMLQRASFAGLTDGT